MLEAPHAPWALRGELVVAFVRRPRDPAAAEALALPPGVRPLGGPVVVMATRYTDSPIGSFVELRVGVPARLGLRPGLCDVVVAVSDPAAKVGMRCNWGFPADVGTITWCVDGDERFVRWEERGIEVRGAPRRAAVPFVVPLRAVQRRGDGPVIVPRTVAAVARLGPTTIVVPSGDELRWMTGPHRGAVVSSTRLVLRPARHPLGLLSSFRAPLRAAEPGLSYRGTGPPASRSGVAAEALQ